MISAVLAAALGLWACNHSPVRSLPFELFKAGSPDLSTFRVPESAAVDSVNNQLGNGGPEPNLSGGMAPTSSPPFAMTRWYAMTRANYVSMLAYNQTDTKIHGFIGTHQPAIWMGESGPAIVSAGLGEVVTDFDARGLPFEKKHEWSSPSYYSNRLDAGENGKLFAELSSTSRVGHLRFTFSASSSFVAPHVVVQASRATIITSDPTNVTFPPGSISILPDSQEIVGYSTERQDWILGAFPASSFAGYFVARFSAPFESWGTSYSGILHEGEREGYGADLTGFARFAPGTQQVEVRVGVSFISIEQARRNLESAIPDGQSLEQTAFATRTAWAEKLDRFRLEGATEENRTVFYTGVFHALQYPYEQHEYTADGTAQYYSGYTDSVQKGESYTGYSIWDTFRAAQAFLILFAPERLPSMMQSMLQDFKESGWLPMWKNIVETNIMVGTHADSLLAEGIAKGVSGFDYDLAWEAVRKDATVPPDRDIELVFADREEHTPVEARAGLTEYKRLGYVADDLHTEAGSRTLDYAYDDWATSVVAAAVGAHDDAAFLLNRSRTYKNLWNSNTGFMEARFSNGSWAGEDAGWTEGDHWAYSFDVPHDVPGLVSLVGGNASFVSFLDRHFDGGHNLHTNEPSHHIPYLYALAGKASRTQEHVLSIAQNEYNATADGLSGNEDCGQMSAWYIFSAMGFYPVDPVSATYVIGTPFFDKLTTRFPGASRPLTISAPGTSAGRKYVRSVRVDGRVLGDPVIRHEWIKDGAEIVFEMEESPQEWGNTVEG